MNWEAIGAVGEVAGAIGVIATLTYLAVQIRQNTKAIRGATLDSITEHQQFELRWSSDIGTSFRKSIEAPGELTDQETWEVTEWMTSAFVARQNEFKQFKQGLLDEDNWAACEKIIYMCLGSVWAQNWWKPRPHQGLSEWLLCGSRWNAISEHSLSELKPTVPVNSSLSLNISGGYRL